MIIFFQLNPKWSLLIKIIYIACNIIIHYNYNPQLHYNFEIAQPSIERNTMDHYFIEFITSNKT
jgi:hypothetical protein